MEQERGKTSKQECPSCVEKRGEGKGEMDHLPSDEKRTCKPVFVLSSNKWLDLHTKTNKNFTSLL